MACWTPLPSGKLCPRRDPTGRCRIHGSVVPRNPLTGSPVHEADRLRLQAEQADLVRQRKRDLQQRKRRRRYSHLEDISSHAEKVVAKQLRNRLLHPIRKEYGGGTPSQRSLAFSALIHSTVDTRADKKKQFWCYRVNGAQVF
ncbi:unnamed protein product [Dibothriocephalus latus]|uniref:UV-stimulated scaffold protein A C-terminal domain-containing protein n=1 Tax=Dibothriocephalus latus TaxID=60516 RepID=A0A3P7LSV1_DIBLA|nr:unnamed protein product [Dibothriocephalus latus]